MIVLRVGFFFLVFGIEDGSDGGAAIKCFLYWGHILSTREEERLGCLLGGFLSVRMLRG